MNDKKKTLQFKPKCGSKKNNPKKKKMTSFGKQKSFSEINIKC